MIDLASHGWNLWMSRMWLAIWQGGLLTLAAYLVTRLVPRLSPRTRAVIWWCVCAKLLVTLVAPTPIRLGLLPTADPAMVIPSTGPLLDDARPSRPAIVSWAPLSRAEFPWAGLAWTVWLVGVLALLARLIQQHRKVSALIELSQPVSDPRLLDSMDKLATAMGLTQPISLCSSVGLDAPLITGLRRPVIMFPASALSSLEESALKLAVAHELAHLKRRDLLWSWVPILAHTCFWFFPASWLSLREYSQGREEACDADALRVTRGQPDTYARLLVAFSTGRQRWTAIAACSASPHFRHLKRRLTALQRSSVEARDRATFAFAAIGALLLVPIQVVARSSLESIPDLPPAAPAPGAVHAVLPVPKVIIKEINLIGAIKVPADDLKGVMFTRVGGTFREEILQRDLTRMLAAYYDRGFINVKIDEPLVSTSADKRFIHISIKIEEGEAYSIGKLYFSGDLLVPKEGLGKLMTSRQGELFNRLKLSRDISAITDMYLDQGYAFANLTPLTQLHPEQRLVDLTFDILKGNQVYTERIDIRGNNKTRDDEIRREMRIHEGELFSGTGERRSKERLTALGLFETVEVQHKPGSVTSKVVVAVDVKEKDAADG
jgi:beta-lactamase regulating signal transducer with metallopeptidase domain